MAAATPKTLKMESFSIALFRINIVMPPNGAIGVVINYLPPDVAHAV